LTSTDGYQLCNLSPSSNNPIRNVQSTHAKINKARLDIAFL
jgi:hypothetical protein